MLGTHTRRLWNMGLRFRGDDGNGGEPIRRIWSDMTETSARPAVAIYRGMDRAALDALTREQLQRELLQIWARTRVTIVFVTHSVEEAALLADRVLVMSAGPGRIESDIRIDLPRPRDVSSPEFNAVRRELAQRLTSHMAPSRVFETVV